jgi:hypothetical protein
VIPQVKHRWRKWVCAIYQEFGDKPFTAREALDVVGVKRSGMFAYLRDMGAIKIRGGALRSHYHSYSDGPTKWMFTHQFITYLENGGLKELED